MGKNKIMAWLGRVNPLYICCILLVLYFLPFCIMGEDSCLLIHDNLDSALTRIKIVYDHHAMFHPDQILPVMDGLPRCFFPGMLNIKMWLFMFLPCFWAYMLNAFIVKMVALLGMFLLLRDYVLEKQARYLCAVLAFIFALVPFYTDYDLSSAGIPIVVWAFLNLYASRRKAISYVSIILFAFYSSFVLSGLFLCLFIFVLFVYKACKEKKFFSPYLYGMALLFGLYALINYTLFAQFFLSSDFVSIRSEFGGDYGWRNVITEMISLLRCSQYHAGSCFSALILLVFALSFFFAGTRRKDTTFTCSEFRLSKRRLLFFFITIIGLIFTAKLLKVLLPECTLLYEFQFDRFYFLLPTLYFLMLADAVSDLWHTQRMKPIAVLTLALVLSYNFTKDFELKNTSLTMLGKAKPGVPSYRQFFDEKLFDSIANALSIEDRTACKTVVVGMHPAVTEYNGFHTLDAYMTNYPLEYKHKFRNVIASELEKSEHLRSYFDEWGGRCYVFSAELNGFCLCGKYGGETIQHLNINIEALKELGCQYIFSAVPINNHEQLGVAYLGSYTTDNSFWNVYVYRIG